MRQHLLLASNHDHMRPLPSLRAVDCRELDAFLAVAACQQLPGLVLELLQKVARAHALCVLNDREFFAL
jgi:hypothetical protein